MIKRAKRKIIALPLSVTSLSFEAIGLLVHITSMSQNSDNDEDMVFDSNLMQEFLSENSKSFANVDELIEEIVEKGFARVGEDGAIEFKSFSN